jgi:hypothetical protein
MNDLRDAGKRKESPSLRNSNSVCNISAVVFGEKGSPRHTEPIVDKNKLKNLRCAN